MTVNRTRLAIMAATSAKTLETLTPNRLAKPAEVFNAIRDHVEDAAKFESYNLKNVSLSAKDIVVRRVHVAVQEKTTPAQWKEIQKAIEYGKSRGVEVIVSKAK